MDKGLSLLALARKGGRVELGEEPVGAVARAQKAHLVIVASDATDHTWRRAKSFVAGSEQICLKVPYSKDQLGEAIGRTALAMAAFTDPALALAFVKALGQPERFKAELERLETRAARIRQRQQEAKAHEKNKAVGYRGKAKKGH